MRDRLMYIPTLRGWVEMLNQRAVGAWNRGDLEGFCELYAPDAVMVTKDGVFKGQTAILDAYKAAYPDKNSMGRIRVEIVDLRFQQHNNTEDPWLAIGIMRCTLTLSSGVVEVGHSMCTFAGTSEKDMRILQDTST